MVDDLDINNNLTVKGYISAQGNLSANDIDAKINYELLKNKISQNKEQKDGENKENNENVITDPTAIPTQIPSNAIILLLKYFVFSELHKISKERLHQNNA